MIAIAILFAAAVLPPIYLGKKIYAMDRIEPEPASLLRKLFRLGALACLPAVILERIAEYAFGITFQNMNVYLIVEVFAGVALVEELCKYYFLKRTTWRSPEFNYRFDGIVYAVMVTLGFAALENILYVFSYGFGTALVRALLSIPGHCIFGIYMGFFYGNAKKHDYQGEPDRSSRQRILAVLVPTLLHGIYDYLAFAMEVYVDVNGETTLPIFGIFIVYVIVMDVVTIRKVKQFAAEDEPIAPGMWNTNPWEAGHRF